MSDRVYAQVVNGKLEISHVNGTFKEKMTNTGNMKNMLNNSIPQDKHDEGTPPLDVYANESAARSALKGYCRNTDLGGGRKSRRYNKKRSTRVNRKGSKRGTRRSRRVMQHGG